ncbi:MAG TPA: DUF501 domain-containing protein, partial [Acidimicrobiales bacterium]|nr:DUF501 domain-containing protein [Acidimicrobiales bacterium]
MVVRSPDGQPVVIRNAPLLDDGTPMPTLYWLLDETLREAVGRLESTGGVDEAEAAVAETELRGAHDRYAAERAALMPAGHVGPAPYGGVGGTRRGVKCLHAHLAYHLAGGDDPVGRWVVAHLPAEDASRASGMVGAGRAAVAAVDCGTNSTRLLIASATGRTLAREMRITRLGAGVDRTGQLDDEAIARTVAVHADYAPLMGAHGVGRIRAVATSAVRDAGNGSVFLDAAAEALGVRPEVLDGDEEGRLSFAGATAGLPPGRPYLVVDIGGGSTELVRGEREAELAVVSLDVGCVRLSERYLVSDPPSAEELSTARDAVRGLLDEAVAEQPTLSDPATMIGLAGTVSTLAGLDLGLDSYDRDKIHHHELPRVAVDQLLAELTALTAEGRRNRMRLEPGRADVIVGGALALSEVMSFLGQDGLVVS